ncbi:MAG: hypothetical protein QM315_05350 [Bacillota bacterium]|jgi:hypothetical protein|nr:hypothetical protein [Bacillota bacterium]NLV62064.1 hypothetical protein [Clostridiaceae bacterium]
MRGGFTSGMVFGGIVGAMMSMVINHDIDVNRTKKRIMRAGRNIFKKSRRLAASIAGMMR